VVVCDLGSCVICVRPILPTAPRQYRIRATRKAVRRGQQLCKALGLSL